MKVYIADLENSLGKKFSTVDKLITEVFQAAVISDENNSLRKRFLSKHPKLLKNVLKELQKYKDNLKSTQSGTKSIEAQKQFQYKTSRKVVYMLL